MKSKPTSLIKTILPWVLLLFLIGSAYTLLNPSTNRTLTVTEFNQLIESGTKIEQAEITPESLVLDVTGVYTDGQETVQFSVTLPNTDEQISSL